MGPDGKWVEVQIRSERMHEIAEKGYAAHFKYKQGDTKEDGLEVWLNRLQDALENPDLNAVDFVEQFKLNLYSKEIFVFTPKGELKSLPKGATPLDFAFSIHTEVGLKTRGARVNGKLVPLSHELNSGDQVDVITSENQKPTKNWLDYATTARARQKIKSALRDDQKEIALEGKAILARKLRSQKITLDEKSVNQLVNFFKLKTSHELFFKVGNGTIENKDIKEFASSRSNVLYSFIKNKIRKPKENPDLHKEEITENYDSLVFGKDLQQLDYSYSKCCSPLPGDTVFGFITVNEGIKVHKHNCPNAISLQSKFAYRIMPAKWIDSTQQEYKAEITLSGIDRMGLVQEVTRVISENMHVNMKNISFSSNDGVFKGSIQVAVKNKKLLTKLMQNLNKLNGIDKVTRI